MGEKLNEPATGEAGGAQAGGGATPARGGGTSADPGTGTGTEPAPTRAQGGGSQADQSGPRQRPTGSWVDDEGRPIREWTTTERGWTETTDPQYDPETGERAGSTGTARRTSQPGTGSAEYKNPDGTTTKAYQAEHGNTKRTYDSEGNTISDEYEPRDG